MGKFEKKEIEKDGEKKEVGRFGKRTNDTVAAFPVLNARALAETISVMEKKIKEKQKPKKERGDTENKSVKLDDTEFKQLLSSESFEKIYTQFLIEMPEYSVEGLRETRGQWKKYEQGSSPGPLVESLEGYPLEWCTANSDTAKGHLEGGGFHVYYSIDNTGEAKIPRLAMRMDGKSKISEVRGIAPDQNIDPYINEEKDGELGVLDKKLGDFGQEGEDYKKKAGDMQRLTVIDSKNADGGELGKDDLRFLYGLDEKIQGFGNKDDPRVKDILDDRDLKDDISAVTGYAREEIGTTREEFENGEIKFFHGDLDLRDLESDKGLILPEILNGGLDLNSLTSADGLKLPETLNGDLYLRSLASADGLTLPETLNGDLYLNGLISAYGLTLPETLNGSLDLRSLISADGLTLPETLNDDLYFYNLTSADGLTLPKTSSGYLYLNKLPLNEKEKLREKYPHLKII